MKVLIVNSRGFSNLGWMTDPATQQTLVRCLARSGLEVDLTEVADVAELDPLLGRQTSNTLIWLNAYHVCAGAGGPSIPSPERRWLADILEARGVPFVGPSAEALRTVLRKQDCQARLRRAGIPIPRFTTVTERDPQAIRSVFHTAGLTFPAVVKPSSTAGSLGVSLVEDSDALTARAHHLLERFDAPVLIEEYLPSADITVGVLTSGAAPVVLPTWYEIEERQPGIRILERRERLLPWGGVKQMRRIRNPDVLAQIEDLVPHLVGALGIRDITRFDGRLDARGVLRIFDVNGMPALDYPDAVMLRQVMTCDGVDALTALDRLAHTVVASAAERHGLEAPPSVQARALRTAPAQPIAKEFAGTQR